MKVLACDGIHEDGLAMFREAGWTVEISEPIKDPDNLDLSKQRSRKIVKVFKDQEIMEWITK